MEILNLPSILYENQFTKIKQKQDNILTFLFEMNAIQACGLYFELDDLNFTAKIVSSLKISRQIIIPRSINYQSHDYIVTNIGIKSFKKNNYITSIHFTEDSALRSISDKAFFFSSLHQLSIPPSVEELEEGWCKGTSELIQVSVSPGNKFFCSIEDKFIFGKTDKNKDEFDVLLFAHRDIKKIVIAPNIKKIGSYCFAECGGLLSVEFSENSQLVSIERYAFDDSAIKTVSIPPHVTRIGKCAFSWCSELETVNFPENSELQTIEKKAFAYSSISRFSLPPKVTRINRKTFAQCKRLKSIEIPEDSELNSICFYAFASTRIERIFFPQKLRELEEGWCGITSHLNQISISPLNKHFSFVDDKFILGKSDEKSDNFDVLHFSVRNVEQATIPPHITRISSFAFSDCNSLQTINFSEDSKLQSIGEFALYSSAIENIVVPQKVERIEEGTFSKCMKLESVRFADDSMLREIKVEAFAWSSMKSISFPANLAELEDGWCCGTADLNDISISSENSHFFNLEGKYILKKWNDKSEDFDEILFAFRDIESAAIPNNIRRISAYSFFECKNLKTVEFTENSMLTEIGKHAFSTSSIQKIKVPSSVRKMGEGAFTFCFKLTSIEFSEDSQLESIERESFFEAPIQNIVIPEKVKNIGESTFKYCSGLKSFEFLGDDVFIGKNCFRGCDEVLLVSLPNAQTITANQGSFAYFLRKCSVFIYPGANIVNIRK